MIANPQTGTMESISSGQFAIERKMRTAKDPKRHRTAGKRTRTWPRGGLGTGRGRRQRVHAPCGLVTGRPGEPISQGNETKCSVKLNEFAACELTTC